MKDYYASLKKYLSDNNYINKLNDLEQFKKNNDNVSIIKMYNFYKKSGDLKELTTSRIRLKLNRPLKRAKHIHEDKSECSCGGACCSSKIEESNIYTKTHIQMKKTDFLKKLIKEAVMDRIKMIDEAGDIASFKAKVNKIAEDIKNIKDIKDKVSNDASLNQYADPKIMKSLTSDLDKVLKGLEKTKQDLIKGMQKKAPRKTTEKTEQDAEKISSKNEK